MIDVACVGIGGRADVGLGLRADDRDRYRSRDARFVGDASRRGDGQHLLFRSRRQVDGAAGAHLGAAGDIRERRLIKDLDVKTNADARVARRQAERAGSLLESLHV